MSDDFERLCYNEFVSRRITISVSEEKIGRTSGAARWNSEVAVDVLAVTDFDDEDQ
jgi:hypothetical protein